MPRPAAALVAVLCSVGLLAGGATAAMAPSRPAGSPDLAAMAIAVSDLPAGARVLKQGYEKPGESVAEYDRFIALNGASIGRSRLEGLLNVLIVEVSADLAAEQFSQLSDLLDTKEGRDLLRKAFASGFVGDKSLKTVKVTVGKPRHLAIGDGAVSLLVRLTAKRSKRTLDVMMTFLRVDRVTAVLGLYSVLNGHIAAADVDRITGISAAKIKAGLVPVSTAPPTLTGAPLPGQLLTAAPGTWGGDQVAFVYQWKRCDAAGGGCVDIVGATALTYAVTPGDLGSTLRVSVTGKNALGSLTAVSSQTAPVAGPPGSPTATTPPVISGAAQQGVTLTVGTDGWTGSPTSFAFQWRRCDAAGTTCADIPGATASGYLVQPTDKGFTIRVLVIATNGAGPGGAISAQSAVVP